MKKTFKQWVKQDKDLDDFLSPGDYIDERLYNYIYTIELFSTNILILLHILSQFILFFQNKTYLCRNNVEMLRSILRRDFNVIGD